MRTRTLGLVAALVLSLTMAGPSLAGGRANKPYLSLGMCKDPHSTGFIVDIYWGNQAPVAGQPLDVDLLFKAKAWLQYPVTVAAPVPGTGSTSVIVPQVIGPNGPVDWNNYSSVSASSLGAFVASASAVHRPSGGWTACAA